MQLQRVPEFQNGEEHAHTSFLRGALESRVVRRGVPVFGEGKLFSSFSRCGISRRKVSIYHDRKLWLKGRFSWLMTL
jgi:hypothetical protein